MASPWEDHALAPDRVQPTGPSTRPRLEVVPRRRRTTSIIASCCVVLFGLLLGTVAFQTRIAQNQLALDTSERAVNQARERYDSLRRARAELRSPNQLAVEARRLGMVPATSGGFMTVSAETVAAVAVHAGSLADSGEQETASPFDRFAKVKAVAGDAP